MCIFIKRPIIVNSNERFIRIKCNIKCNYKISYNRMIVLIVKLIVIKYLRHFQCVVIILGVTF